MNIKEARGLKVGEVLTLKYADCDDVFPATVLEVGKAPPYKVDKPFIWVTFKLANGSRMVMPSTDIPSRKVSNNKRKGPLGSHP